MSDSTTNFSAPMGTSVRCLTAIVYAALAVSVGAVVVVSLISEMPRWAFLTAVTVSGFIAVASPLLRIRHYSSYSMLYLYNFFIRPNDSIIDVLFA